MPLQLIRMTRLRKELLMTTYIALLRGINVGGNNKIKMAELKNSLENLGLSQVQTYIQSGNLLFRSHEAESVLTRIIEHTIQTDFGITSKVMIRTDTELAYIIYHCPYSAASLSEGESIHEAKDEFHVTEREVYFLFRQSIIDSKLGKNLQKLGNAVTTRNWNTMIKLADLAKGIS